MLQDPTSVRDERSPRQLLCGTTAFVAWRRLLFLFYAAADLTSPEVCKGDTLGDCVKIARSIALGGHETGFSVRTRLEEQTGTSIVPIEWEAIPGCTL
jgi:hypothetical protein